TVGTDGPLGRDHLRERSQVEWPGMRRAIHFATACRSTLGTPRDETGRAAKRIALMVETGAGDEMTAARQRIPRPRHGTGRASGIEENRRRAGTDMGVRGEVAYEDHVAGVIQDRSKSRGVGAAARGRLALVGDRRDGARGGFLVDAAAAKDENRQ